MSPRVQGDTKLLTTFVAGHMIEDDGFMKQLLLERAMDSLNLLKMNNTYLLIVQVRFKPIIHHGWWQSEPQIHETKTTNVGRIAVVDQTQNLCNTFDIRG